MRKHGRSTMALPEPAVDLSEPEESGVIIKQERRDESDPEVAQKVSEEVAADASPQPLGALQSSQALSNLVAVANGVRSSRTHHRHSNSTSSARVHSNSSGDTTTTTSESNPPPPPIDYSSICGAFGWTTIGHTHLPFIMRGDEKFIAVRMVECKIISNYAEILPWTVFTCTNIRSYYITENEAKLLNEINSFHCEFHYGYQVFCSKDVVVRLNDTIRFYEFLETCKARLGIQGANSKFVDHCGFYVTHYGPIPYVKVDDKKYVPLNMIFQEGVAHPISNPVKVTQWELAYLKFLCSVANLDRAKFNQETQLCCIDELQFVLGGVHFEEWWPNMQYTSSNSSSKNDRSHYPSSSSSSRWNESVASTSGADSGHKLREKMSEIQEKDSILNSFFNLNKFVDQSNESSHAMQSAHHGQPNLLGSEEKTPGYFPTLESLLSTTSACDYPYPANYRHQYTASDYDRYRKVEGGLPSSKSRSYPPPPPLVRLGGGGSGGGGGGARVPPTAAAANDPGAMVPKATHPLYPYLPSNASNANCAPWMGRLLDNEWFREELQSSGDAPENLSRRLNGGEDPWGATSSSTSFPSSISVNGAGSSSSSRAPAARDNGYDHGPQQGSSPRLLAAAPGPPPHYPTPPQSSPLQTLSLFDLADVYAPRSTPSGLVDLCSPPPSPEVRTALSGGSPRATHLSGYGYQTHVARKVYLDSALHLWAINMEPLKLNTLVAVSMSEVVNKFLQGTSVQSCQNILETKLGLQLYECTSLQQEVLVKHNVSLTPGSKLVLFSDLKNCWQKLKYLILEREMLKESRHCELLTSELPLAKRWCRNSREC